MARGTLSASAVFHAGMSSRINVEPMQSEGLNVVTRLSNATFRHGPLSIG